jgi:glycosyltransferase involved in cell wall biosynthesis
MTSPLDRRILWLSLADQRAGRELSWLTRMPRTSVTAVAVERPLGDADWIPGRVRRPVARFQEAGALAWYENSESWPRDVDWVGSLEPVSLVSGQASTWRRSAGVRQFVVTWENDAWQPLYYLPPYRQALQRSLDADLFVCPIRGAREHLLARGVDPERIAVVPPGIDVRLFHPPEEPVDAPIIAFASPLARNKGLDRILAALPAVQDAVPDVELRVMGRGPLEPRLHAARRAGLPVRYMGSGGPAAVAEFLRGASVFCTAPRPTWKWNEQFGLAYTEAMATGLPVVTTRCGTNHEAVRPPNALVGDDVDEIAEALVRFLDDPGLRRRVGMTNRLLAEKDHDIVIQAERLGQVFSAHEASA